MINRREFMVITAGGIASIALGTGGDVMAETAGKKRKSRVSLIKTTDRATGIRRAIEVLEMNPIKGKDVLLKPNFNTADPYPASTHNDTLTYFIINLKEMGAGDITIGERSGPPATSDVLKEKGIHEIVRKLGVGLINFEELPPEGWVRIRPEKSHWRDGFDVARPVLDSKCVVTTCCLKTHGFGGVFTMSLKLSVGMVHKRNMRELHSSFLSMRKMIAEINQAYSPALVVMDGIEVFVDGGPACGTRKRGDVIVAGSDRVAIDAVGLAVLKELGSNDAVMEKRIFEQEQIARAAELGLGVTAPGEIEIVTDDEAGRKYADRIMDILMKG